MDMLGNVKPINTVKNNKNSTQDSINNNESNNELSYKKSKNVLSDENPMEDSSVKNLYGYKKLYQMKNNIVNDYESAVVSENDDDKENFDEPTQFDRSSETCANVVSLDTTSIKTNNFSFSDLESNCKAENVQ
eukprot:Pgem_evm1s2091